MRMSAEQNQMGREVKSTVIENFRKGRATRIECKAMVKEAMQQDKLVSWKDISFSIFAILFALGVLSAIAFTLPMLQLFYS